MSVETGSQRLLFVLSTGKCSQGNCRNIAPSALGTDLRQQFISIHVRHAEIGNQYVRAFLHEQLQRLGRRCSFNHGCSITLERRADHFARIVIVLDQQDPKPFEAARFALLSW